MDAPTYTTVAGQPGSVVLLEADAATTGDWLVEAYGAECQPRNLRTDLAALDVGDALQTHPDWRGVRVRRIT